MVYKIRYCKKITPITILCVVYVKIRYSKFINMSEDRPGLFKSGLQFCGAFCHPNFESKKNEHQH